MLPLCLHKIPPLMLIQLSAVRVALVQGVQPSRMWCWWWVECARASERDSVGVSRAHAAQVPFSSRLATHDPCVAVAHDPCVAVAVQGRACLLAHASLASRFVRAALAPCPLSALDMQWPGCHHGRLQPASPPSKTCVTCAQTRKPTCGWLRLQGISHHGRLRRNDTAMEDCMSRWAWLWAPTAAALAAAAATHARGRS